MIDIRGIYARFPWNFAIISLLPMSDILILTSNSPTRNRKGTSHTVFANNEGQSLLTCADPEGGGGGAGGPDPPKNLKNIGFLSHSGPDPLKKNTKLPSQHSMLGHHQHARETPLKWRFAGGPLVTR